ncbi:MAG: DUF3301 domain-containing protein [Gammaproteobacteria bacterium]
MNIINLLLLLLLAVIVLFWFETLRLREQVIIRCQQVCREANLQLLDQTVALIALSLRKALNGGLHLYRRYQFEVSDDGVNRFPGYVDLVGRHIITISFAGPDGKTIYFQSPTLH